MISKSFAIVLQLSWSFIKIGAVVQELCHKLERLQNCQVIILTLSSLRLVNYLKWWSQWPLLDTWGSSSCTLDSRWQCPRRTTASVYATWCGTFPRVSYAVRTAVHPWGIQTFSFFFQIKLGRVTTKLKSRMKSLEDTPKNHTLVFKNFKNHHFIFKKGPF